MGFLSAYTGSVRIKVGPPDTDYWVDLKKYITQGAQESAEAALAKVVIKDGETQPAPDVAKYRKLMVLAAIDDWNLDDDNGQILPINLQSVQKLPMPVFDQLWLQTQKNNSETERSSDEQLDFRQ
jgi:hypothetical protein